MPLGCALAMLVQKDRRTEGELPDGDISDRGNGELAENGREGELTEAVADGDTGGEEELVASGCRGCSGSCGCLAT